LVSSIVIKDKQSGLAYSFNNYDATFLIEDGSIDWGEVKTSHSTFSFPQQIGEFVSSTIISGRTVTIYGWVAGKTYDEVKSKKSMLNRFITPLHEYLIISDNYCITGKPDAQVKYSKEYTDNNDIICKFFISLFCANPVFELVEPVSTVIASVIPKFGFPLTFKPGGIILGARETSLISSITNTGINQAGMVITFSSNGVVNNPKLINIGTQEFLKLNAVINVGDRIEVSTVNGSRYVKAYIGGVEQSYYDALDLDSSWLQLNPGVTNLSFTTELDGVLDESYRSLVITVSYTPSLFNLEEE
jgi:hypothetical protein